MLGMGLGSQYVSLHRCRRGRFQSGVLGLVNGGFEDGVVALPALIHSVLAGAGDPRKQEII